MRTILSALPLLLAMPLHAAIINWDGSSSGLWSNSLNWSGALLVPLTDDELVFPAAGANKSMNNDLGVGGDVNRLTFSSSGYTLAGDRIDLSSTVATPLLRATHTSGTTTINAPFGLLEASIFSSVAGGTLNFGSTGDVALSTFGLTLSSGGTLGMGGTISGSGGVTLNGSGAVRYTALQSYSGTTSLNSGTLTVTGTGSVTNSAISVASIATLAGSGTVNAVTTSGVISPGDGGIGKFTASGNVTFNSATTAKLVLELGDNTTAGTTYDQLSCGGTVTIGSSSLLELVATGTFAPSIGQSYVLLSKSSAGAITNTFSGLPQGGFVDLGSKRLQISYTGGDGNDLTATAVNVPPVLANGSTLVYTENQAATAINTAITVTDLDNATLSSATVSITGNFASGQDVLGFTNVLMGNIAGSYNSLTGVLTLTSSGATATLAQWQAALRAVTYSNSSDNPTTTARTVSYLINDGSSNSNTLASTVNITAVNDAPVLAGSSTLSYIENQAATAINTVITVTDPDNVGPASATVSISANFASGQDFLGFTNVAMGNIVGSYDNVTGVLTLTSAGGTATLAQWQAALRAVTYFNSSENPLAASRTLAYRVNDGVVNSNLISSTINVTAVNDVPTIASIVDQAITEDTSTAAIPVNIGDAETAASSLSVTRSSNNLTLVPTANIVLGGTGASRTVTVTPAANQSGTATITVSVSDGANVTSTTFLLTVSAVNDAPTISSISDRAVNEDTDSVVNFTIGDVDTAAGSLVLTVTSSDLTLVPLGNIILSGTGTSRTVTVTPATNLSGSSTITITVSDGLLSASEPYLLTVNAVNDPPTITTLENLTIDEDSATSALPFTIGDVETAAASLTVFASSTNNTLVPTANIVFSGTGANRFVTITPAANQNGTAFISIFVNDGSVSVLEQLLLTVTAVNDVPTISVIANQGINEDSTTGGLSFTISDVETAVSSLVVSASTSDAVLLPLSNIILFGTGANRSVQVTPAANLFGTASVTLSVGDGSLTGTRIFQITVAPVNDVPSFVNGPNQTLPEDSGLQSLPAWATAISAGPANESSQTLAFEIVGNTNPALFLSLPTINSSGDLSFTPRGNAVGSAFLSVRMTDSGGTANGGVDTSAVQVFGITITSVNDVPEFSAGPNQTVLEDAGAQSIAGWASAITDGDPEVSQSLFFNVSNDNNALFSSQPTIASDGTLNYATAANVHGSAIVSVSLTDDANAGGVPLTSAVQTFVITVTPVNDRPTFVFGPSQGAQEDAGAQTAVGWATNISPGPNEAGQSIQFVIASNSNPSLFSAGPVIAADGTLTWTPAPDANGVAIIGVRLTDDGGTANGGLNSTLIGNFQIQVSAVNDSPSYVKGANVTVLEDAGPQVIPGWATAISPGALNESAQTLTFTVIGTSGTLTFLTPPALNAAGALSFTISANAVGSTTLQVSLFDGEISSPTQTFVITSTPVNDAPTFFVGPNQSHSEGTQLRTVNGWISSSSVGPPDEVAQTRSFEIASNSNPGLFGTLPSVTSSGSLSYSIGFGLNGSAIIGVRMRDSGGTADGGVDVSATQNFTINVTPSNNQPTFSGGPGVIVNEDAGPQSIPLWATNISPGPPDESGQIITFLFTFNTASQLFSAGPAVSADGTLTFTPAPNANGLAQLSVVAKDSGATNPGIDTSPSYSFTITINALNDLPVVALQSLTVPKNVRLPVTLTSTDFEGNPRTLSIVTPPAHGTLSEFISPSGSLGPMNLIYTPDAGYTGTDSFTYRATDADPGLPAAVSITITEPPVATGITRVWDGGAGTSFWADAANWVGDVAPQPGDSLSFPNGATGVANTSNNLPPRFVVDDIILSAAQTVTGNPLALLGGIESAKLVNWNVALDFVAPGYLRALPSNTVSSFLSITGEINLGPFLLAMEATGATLSIRNRILGSGGVSTVGNVSLENGSTIAGVFTGGVTVETGSLQLVRQIIGQRTVVAGPVEVKGGASLIIDSIFSQATFSPLDETSSITLREGAFFSVDGFAGTTQRIASLFVEGGIVGVASGNSLKITGDITVSGPALSSIGTGSPNAAILFDGAATEHAIHVPTNSRLRVDSFSLIFAEALVRKTGGGTLDLNGKTQFTGGLSVDAGWVRFFTDLNPGDFGADAQLTPIVINGGSVSGASMPDSRFARCTGTITSGLGGGTLSPTTDRHEMRTLSLALNPSTTFRTEFLNNQDPPNRRFDLTLVQGTINLGGAAFDLVRPSGFISPSGESIVVIENDGTDAITGTFAGMPEGHITTVGNVTYQISYAGGDGNDVSLFFNVLPTGTTRVWDGGGNSNNWSEAANWTGDSAPQPGDSLEFPSPSLRHTPLNDYPLETTFHQIRITGTGPRYDINGNPLRLSGGVISTGSITGFSDSDVFLCQVKCLADQSIVKSGTRRLFVSGVNTQGNTLTLNDQLANPPVQTDRVGIQVSLGGTGNAVIQGAGSTMVQEAVPVHSGSLQVRSGTMVLAQPASFNNRRTGPLIVGGFGEAATVLTLGIEAHNPAVATTIGVGGSWICRKFTSESFAFQSFDNLTLSGGSLAAELFTNISFRNLITAVAGTSSSITGELRIAEPFGGAVTVDVGAGAVLAMSGGASSVSSTIGSFISKTGVGTLAISSAMTCPRLDAVAGIIHIDGSAPGTLIRLLGGTLAGSGGVGAVTSITGGVVSPGSGVGTLSSGEINWNAATTFALDFSSGGLDQLAVTGPVALGSSTLALTLLEGFQPSAGQELKLIENDAAEAVIGTFAGLPEGSTFTAAGKVWLITYQGGTGNDVVLTRQAGQTALEAWRQLNFGNSANTGNAANNFDFDKDGLVNLIEFAFGLDPKSNSAHLLPQAQRVGNELVISFTPPPGISGVTYGAEASDTLSADDWQPVPNTGTATQRVFRVAIGPENSKFIRLTVSDP